MLIISQVGGTENRPILKPIEFTQIKCIGQAGGRILYNTKRFSTFTNVLF